MLYDYIMLYHCLLLFLTRKYYVLSKLELFNVKDLVVSWIYIILYHNGHILVN